NAALAKLLQAPVILVIDVQGSIRGVAPLLLGYQAFDLEVNIAGVILNKVGGARHESKLRQRIILELYDKFFRSAFPRLTEKLGIVYTPVEVVDFIIRGVDQLLHQEFGYGLVKNPAVPAPGQIYIYDIGDNLTREEKLAKLVAWEQLSTIDWQRIQPDNPPFADPI
ncbi:hypothetical protein TI04_13665, partial [Achromatium sp. WMS2]